MTDHTPGILPTLPVLAALNHEMRTPLNAVINLSQLLLDDPLTHEQQDSIKTILESGQHMLAVLEQMQDSPYIPRSQAEHFELQEELEQCCHILQAQARTRRIELEIIGEHAPTLYQLRSGLRQVLLNLISNAIKYNQEGGRVTLETELGRESVAIRVEDTGIGMTDNDIEQLFRPFNRLAAATQMAEGSGLGLTIARDLISRMGGNIHVASTPGKGSCFMLLLPLYYSQQHQISIR